MPNMNGVMFTADIKNLMPETFIEEEKTLFPVSKDPIGDSFVWAVYVRFSRYTLISEFLICKL